VARCLVLERGGDSPEGYRGRPFGGPLRLLRPWALLCFGLQPPGAYFVVCGFVCLLFIIFRKGVFPSLGDSHGCPDTMIRRLSPVAVSHGGDMCMVSVNLVVSIYF
jgi:hypothetical protein